MKKEIRCKAFTFCLAVSLISSRTMASWYNSQAKIQQLIVFWISHMPCKPWFFLLLLIGNKLLECLQTKLTSSFGSIWTQSNSMLGKKEEIKHHLFKPTMCQAWYKPLWNHCLPNFHHSPGNQVLFPLYIEEKMKTTRDFSKGSCVRFEFCLVHLIPIIMTFAKIVTEPSVKVDAGYRFGYHGPEHLARFGAICNLNENIFHLGTVYDYTVSWSYIFDLNIKFNCPYLKVASSLCVTLGKLSWPGCCQWPLGRQSKWTCGN